MLEWRPLPEKVSPLREASCKRCDGNVFMKALPTMDATTLEDREIAHAATA